MPLALARKDFFLARDAQRERIDQWILRVTRLEADFAADGRNAKTIAVVRHAANHAIENKAILGRFFLARLVACCSDVAPGFSPASFSPLATRHSPLAVFRRTAASPTLRSAARPW